LSDLFRADDVIGDTTSQRPLQGEIRRRARPTGCGLFC
jgi:hypothetical protein